VPIEDPNNRSLITEATWPSCPTCNRPADEIQQTPAIGGFVTLTAVCRTCHRRDLLTLPAGFDIRKTFWGIQAREPARTLRPGDYLTQSGHRVGPMGGSYRNCEICGQEYEMLQDQVTHEYCPGPSRTLPPPVPAHAVCGKQVSRVSDATCKLDSNHNGLCSAKAPPEPSKDEEKTTNRFSWLEVD
jgi:hypothetical protein